LGGVLSVFKITPALAKNRVGANPRVLQPPAAYTILRQQEWGGALGSFCRWGALFAVANGHAEVQTACWARRSAGAPGVTLVVLLLFFALPLTAPAALHDPEMMAWCRGGPREADG